VGDAAAAALRDEAVTLGASEAVTPVSRATTPALCSEEAAKPAADPIARSGACRDCALDRERCDGTHPQFSVARYGFERLNGLSHM
jgi:hypothetical protein